MATEKHYSLSVTPQPAIQHSASVTEVCGQHATPTRSPLTSTGALSRSSAMSSGKPCAGSGTHPSFCAHRNVTHASRTSKRHTRVTYIATSHTRHVHRNVTHASRTYIATSYTRPYVHCNVTRATYILSLPAPYRLSPPFPSDPSSPPPLLPHSTLIPFLPPFLSPTPPFPFYSQPPLFPYTRHVPCNLRYFFSKKATKSNDVTRAFVSFCSAPTERKNARERMKEKGCERKDERERTKEKG
jgi:hypothetical protein